MDLRHLRFIVASARNGSFSAAAHKFNVRQPIVSKRIKQVEQELGIQLFDRTIAGARLTPAGEEFMRSPAGSRDSSGSAAIWTAR